MLLYRFLNQQYALEALQQGKLKVGRLSELNDPADCSPRLIYKKRKEEEVLQSLLEQNNKLSGILCFSRAINDPVIWSHYADSHRGIALGYNSKPWMKLLAPVLYHPNERPTLDFKLINKLYEQLPETSRAMSEAVLPAYRTKAPSWSYEKEFRMFPPLDEMEMQGTHYFYNGIYPDAVVLGLRCCLNENDIVRAYGGEKHKRDTLVVQRARQHPNHFSLLLEPLRGPNVSPSYLTKIVARKTVSHDHDALQQGADCSAS